MPILNRPALVNALQRYLHDNRTERFTVKFKNKNGNTCVMTCRFAQDSKINTQQNIATVYYSHGQGYRNIPIDRISAIKFNTVTYTIPPGK